jgi:hypothetical protein
MNPFSTLFLNPKDSGLLFFDLFECALHVRKISKLMCNTHSLNKHLKVNISNFGTTLPINIIRMQVFINLSSFDLFNYCSTVKRLCDNVPTHTKGKTLTLQTTSAQDFWGLKVNLGVIKTSNESFKTAVVEYQIQVINKCCWLQYGS